MTLRRSTSADSGLSPRARCLLAYLQAELRESDGDLYVKSRFLADDLDYSAQEIGAAMGRLADAEAGPVVEKWAYSSATTWRISEK